MMFLLCGGMCTQATLQSQGSSRHNSPEPRYVHPALSNAPRSTRHSRWFKNVFFASDFIANKVATATAAAETNNDAQCRGAKLKLTREMSTSGRAPQTRDRGVEQSNNKSTRGVGKSRSRTSRPSGTIAWGLLDRGRLSRRFSEPQDQRKTPQTCTNPNVAGEGAVGFLEEAASALLLLHSRFFQGVEREEDLVCRMCTMCREAGWMGANTRNLTSHLDPLVVEELMSVRLDNTRKTMQCRSKQTPRVCRDRWNASAASLSFEDFYGVLADIAAFVYPRDAKEEACARPGQSLHRLLLEGVLPLAADMEPRLWSPRWEEACHFRRVWEWCHASWMPGPHNSTS